MEFKKRNIVLFLLVTTVVVCLLPYMIEHLIFRNNAFSILSNSDWASFLGSYIGGVFGGLMTLSAVMATIYYSTKVAKNNDKKYELEIVEKIKPIFTFNNLKEIIEPKIENEDEDEDIYLTYPITIKNIGGMAYGIKGDISSKSDADSSLYMAARPIFIPSGESVQFNLGVYTDARSKNIQREINIVIVYSDIKTNFYKQEMTFVLNNRNVAGVHKVEIPISICKEEFDAFSES